MFKHRMTAVTLVLLSPATVALAEQIAFPHFGLSIAAPTGDHRTSPRTFDTVASWVLYEGDDAAKTDAVFQLAVHPMRSRSLEQMVALLADSHGATPKSSELKLNGQPAMEFTVQPDDRRQVRYVAGAASSRFILATYIAIGEPRRNDEFNAWVASLHTQVPAAPDEHLLPIQGAAPIAGSELVFSPMAPMRPVASDPSTRTTEFGIQDYRDDSSDALLTVKVADRPNDEPFDQSLAALGKSIAGAFSLDNEIAFTQVTDAASRWNRCNIAYSKPIKMPRTTDAEDDGSVYRSFTIASGDPGEVLFCQFEIYTTDENVAASYADAIAALASSIRRGDAYRGGVQETQKQVGEP